ncbi:sterile alpha motif domain-containing protein 3 isoform X2 [Gasterosteus aculeatus]
MTYNDYIQFFKNFIYKPYYSELQKRLFFLMNCVSHYLYVQSFSASFNSFFIYISDNDVDGETVDCRLTENMIAYLFDKSFKKQLKFRDFTHRYKEVTVTLEVVNPEQQTCEASVSPANQRLESTCHRLPAVISIPQFLQDVQSRLDAKEPVRKKQKYRNKIIGTLYDMLSQCTMYPTNSDYVQVVKALIGKYPFLRDVHGNGYHTWHSQLKRKFQTEQAPLINNEVKRVKEKFWQARLLKTPQESTSTCPKRLKPSLESCIVGEDATSVEAQIKVLEQYRKLHPDMNLVKDRMMKTFAWRRREIAKGMSTEDLLRRSPFLRTSAGLCEEVDAMHPSPVNICHRISENFTSILPNMLKLVKDSPLKKLYMEAREDALAEDIKGIDFRGGLLLLPSILKEKIEDFIMLGQKNPQTPYPTVQLKAQGLKFALSRQCQSVVNVEGIEVCSCTSVDEAFIAAFCMYFVFNMAYPGYLKKTLTFLQRLIANITGDGDKSLPVTVTRIVNLLH